MAKDVDQSNLAAYFRLNETYQVTVPAFALCVIGERGPPGVDQLDGRLGTRHNELVSIRSFPCAETA